MNRTMARETVMQIYYQMDIHDAFDRKIGQDFLDIEFENEKDMNTEYVDRMIGIIIDKKEEIDTYIKESLKNWTMDRISKVDLSILRIAVGEILFANDIPVKVSINEAIELGKRFGTENSSNFINGVLGNLAKKGIGNELE